MKRDSLSILAMVRSYPGVFFELKLFLIIFLILLDVVNFLMWSLQFQSPCKPNVWKGFVLSAFHSQFSIARVFLKPIQIVTKGVNFHLVKQTFDFLIKRLRLSIFLWLSILFCHLFFRSAFL